MIIPVLLLMMMQSAVQQPALITGYGTTTDVGQPETLEKHISDLEKTQNRMATQSLEIAEHELNLEKRVQELEFKIDANSIVCVNCANPDPSVPTIVRKPLYTEEKSCISGYHLERWHYGNDGIAPPAIAIYRNDPSEYRKYEELKVTDPHPDKCVKDTPSSGDVHGANYQCGDGTYFCGHDLMSAMPPDWNPDRDFIIIVSGEMPTWLCKSGKPIYSKLWQYNYIQECRKDGTLGPLQLVEFNSDEAPTAIHNCATEKTPDHPCTPEELEEMKKVNGERPNVFGALPKK